MRRTIWLTVVGAVVMTAGAFVPVAFVPASGGGAAHAATQPIDCVNWRYGPADEPAPGVLPTELDRDSYKVASRRDPRPELFTSPHNQCGQKGPALDLAMGVTTGSRRRLDRRPRLRHQVARRGRDGRPRPAGVHQRRRGRVLRAPRRAATATATAASTSPTSARSPTATATALADPEDLILDPLYNNEVDDDHNGYVDDISGWDFLYGDNDPLDTVSYGHGTGEAEDSTAAANGTGDVGMCPNCRFLPVRVGDSFIADGGRFAAGVLFALDSGADVIQEALGAISNPPQAQQAIDAAYARNVVVVASMADEAAKHANLPSSLEHTMAVNSVTEKEDLPSVRREGLPRAERVHELRRAHVHRRFRRAPARRRRRDGASGMVGLIESIARDMHLDLTANEVMQVVRATADDIDFSTPNAVDPANDFGTPTGGLIDTVRYPTTAKWDATFGYGRVNIYEAVKAVRDAQHPTGSRHHVTAVVRRAAGDAAACPSPVASRRRTRRRYDYRLEWATGLQPPLYPKTDVWHVAASHTGLHAPVDGVLGELDLRRVAAALPNKGNGHARRPHHGPPRRRALFRAAPRRRHRARRHRRRAHRRAAEAGLRARRSRARGGLPARRCRRCHRQPGVRRPRRQEGRRARRRDRRRVGARVPFQRLGDSGLAGATPRCRAIGRRASPTAGAFGIHPPNAAIGTGAPVVDRPRRRRRPRGRRHRHRRQRLGLGGTTARDDRASRRPCSTGAMCRRCTSTRSSPPTAPRPARTSSTGRSAASVPRRPPATSTETATSRSSPPRSTGTCTRGTTTGHRSPASRCCSSTPRRSLRSPRSRTTSPSCRRPARARAASCSPRRRSATSPATAGPRSSSARRRSTTSRSTSARVPTCSRCCLPRARSATHASTRSRPTAPTRRTPRRRPRTPTSRPTCRAGRSRSGCCNSSRSRPSATESPRRP